MPTDEEFIALQHELDETCTELEEAREDICEWATMAANYRRAWEDTEASLQAALLTADKLRKEISELERVVREEMATWERKTQPHQLSRLNFKADIDRLVLATLRATGQSMTASELHYAINLDVNSIHHSLSRLLDMDLASHSFGQYSAVGP